jgi:glucuronokinase
MTIVTRAHARAGLLGNPSDGYFGKIIAISVKNFSARAVIRESEAIRIEPPAWDAPVYADAGDFRDKIGLYGYYGGTRLIQASIKVFFDHCAAAGLSPEGQFRDRYDSGHPAPVGLGGFERDHRTAMRGLMAFSRVEIPLEVLPTRSPG